MDVFFDLVGRVSHALASISKLILASIVLFVICDVAFRNLGLRPLSWTISATEYGLLYAAFLPAPWLVRTKGHIFVEFFRIPLPKAAQDILERIVYIGCVVLSLYLCWYATSAMIDALNTGAYETRTFDMPKWAIYLPIALAFFISAIEWSRYLLGYDSLYDYDPLKMEGL